MKNNIAVLDSVQVAKLIGQIDVLSAMRRMFLALGQEKAVQPPQLRNPFPNGQGNFISYLGTLAEERVFGAKLSPYIPRPEGALVTAWTLMMSMEDGQPRLLCDSGQLTAERTAGTTALAVDLLAPAHVSKLAVVGTGRLGQAHVRHVASLREWGDIRLYAPNIGSLPESEQQALRDIDPRVSLHTELTSAVDDADVIMLCTCLLYTSPSPRDLSTSRMPSSA